MKRVAFFIPHVGCPRQCIFCNQNTISGCDRPPSVDEVEATLYEIAKENGFSQNDTEIAFFGGSFTAIPPEIRKAYLDVAKKYCTEQGFSGIRFSTRPDCISEEIMKELSLYPISTIELGVQSLDNRVLELNNRGNSAADVYKAVGLIKGSKLGLTLQMMVGMYGDSESGAIETAKKIIELSPNEVRIYPTLVLKDTYLEELYNCGKYLPLELERTIEIGSKLLEMFEKANISVIRLGLHQEDGLVGNIIAGPHHPALRELCEGQKLYRRILTEINLLNCKIVTVYLSKYDVSKLTGHDGWVLRKFDENGINLTLKVDSNFAKGQIKIEQKS